MKATLLVLWAWIAVGNQCATEAEDTCHRAGVTGTIALVGRRFQNLTTWGPSQVFMLRPEVSKEVSHHCLDGLMVLSVPPLGRPRNGTPDMKWLSLAATTADVVVYVAHDNVFETDKSYISVILAEQEHPMLGIPSRLHTVVVALDTQRDVLDGDEVQLWSPVTEIPRASVKGRRPVALDFVLDVSVITPNYLQSILHQHPDTGHQVPRTCEEVVAEVRSAVNSLFGPTASAADEGRYWMPSLAERVAAAMPRMTPAEALLHDIDLAFNAIFAEIVTLPASSTTSWSYHEQRLKDEASRLRSKLNRTGASLDAFLRDQAFQRISLHLQQFETARFAAVNEHYRLRDSLCEASIRVYAYWSSVQAADAPNTTQAGALNCTAGTAASALSCTMEVLRAIPAIQANPSLRAEVVDDLLYTDALFQQYELFRDVKDFIVARSTQTHFLRTMSMLLDAGYTQAEATDLVCGGFDDLIADLEADGEGSGSWAKALKEEFLQAVVHFPTRPRIVYNFPPPAPGRKSKFKSMVRGIAAAVVGATISIFMPAAVPAVLPSLGAFGTAVLTGATAGAASGLINKDKRLEKTILRSAMLAGAANIIGDALPAFEAAKEGAAAGAGKDGAFSFANAAARLAAEGVAGCVASEVTGGKCKHGLVQGAVGEVAASTRVLLGVESRLLSAALAGSASATSAWAVGGSWEEGFLHGVIIDQFNHAMHDLKSKLEAKDLQHLPPDELVIDLGEGVNGQLGKLLALAKDCTATNEVRKLRLMGEYVTAAGLGAVDFAVDMATGVVTVIAHPLDTAAAVSGFLSSPDALDKLQQAAAEHLRRVADLRGATDSPQAFRTWTKDVLDVASVVFPASKASGAGKLVQSARAAGTRTAKKLTPIVLETVPLGTTNIQVLGGIAERNVAAHLRAQGYKIHRTQLPNGSGVDVFGSRLNAATGLTDFVVVEVKATSKTLTEASPVRLGRTRHGVQMDTDWLSKKFQDLYKTNPQLVRDVLHTMEASKGAAPPTRMLYRPTADRPLHFDNSRLPHFDSGEFHRALKDIIR